MSHYKVTYKVEDFTTPHYRFYSAVDASTATEMFKETCQETLCGYDVELMSVSQVLEQDDDIHDCGCDASNCCDID